MTTLDPQPVRAATAEQVEAAWQDPKLANVLYHDWEAQTYDDKWSISFDDRCIDYARERFVHVAGEGGWPYGDALELGCGTGFFLLNLMQAGVALRGHVTDLSPGMVEVALQNAQGLGLDVDGRVADAERLPYPDDSMDLVVGHAVLHHIPDLEQSFREILRVLRPGGRFVFAGEPTKYGDYVARRLSRATWWAATHATRLPGLEAWRRPAAELDESSRAAILEAVVDLHVFPPADLAALAQRAGAVEVGTRTVELTAAWLGWPVRTFECAVPREKLGLRWATFAMKSWQNLSKVDAVLERVVPAGLFYNVEITGVKPLKTTWLFDLDGTLSESAPGIIGAMRLAFAELGIPPLDDATERALVGPPWAVMLPPLIGDRQTAEVIAAYRTHYVDGGLMYDTKLYAGVVDLLDALRAAGVTMAIATSKPESYAVPIVERLGLTDYFATIGGDGLHSEFGTKALVVGEVLRRLGDPDVASVIMVGDRVHDVEGAAAHGIATVGVRWGYSDGDELERAGAVAVFDTAADLLAALPELRELP